VVASNVQQFSRRSVQKNAGFSSLSELVGLSAAPEAAVHFRPVLPHELSRLLSDVRRSDPEVVGFLERLIFQIIIFSYLLPVVEISLIASMSFFIFPALFKVTSFIPFSEQNFLA